MTDPDFLQVPPMRILETERLRLRTVRMSDAAALMPIVTDETTMKYTSGLIANDIEVVTRWLSARALGKDILNFVITLKDDGPPEEGQIVGIMGSYHWPEIGYLMNPGMLLCKLSTLDGMFKVTFLVVWS
jgi:RimJ/RimL family protein N-acetyltransferase